MGGNITVKDYLSSYNGAFKDQIENRYKDCNDDDLISFVYGEDRLPVKGEKSVLFLTDSTLYNGYSRVGAFMGSLYEDTQDTSTLSSNGDVYEGYIGTYTLQEIRKTITQN